MKNIQIDRDVLYDLYITQNMSAKQIGAIVGVSKATIQSKLVKYGIVKDKQIIAIPLKSERETQAIDS